MNNQNIEATWQAQKMFVIVSVCVGNGSPVLRGSADSLDDFLYSAGFVARKELSKGIYARAPGEPAVLFLECAQSEGVTPFRIVRMDPTGLLVIDSGEDGAFKPDASGDHASLQGTSARYGYLWEITFTAAEAEDIERRTELSVGGGSLESMAWKVPKMAPSEEPLLAAPVAAAGPTQPSPSPPGQPALSGAPVLFPVARLSKRRECVNGAPAGLAKEKAIPMRTNAQVPSAHVVGTDQKLAKKVRDAVCAVLGIEDQDSLTDTNKRKGNLPLARKSLAFLLVNDHHFNDEAVLPEISTGKTPGVVYAACHAVTEEVKKDGSLRSQIRKMRAMIAGEALTSRSAKPAPVNHHAPSSNGASRANTAVPADLVRDLLIYFLWEIEGVSLEQLAKSYGITIAEIKSAIGGITIVLHDGDRRVLQIMSTAKELAAA